MADAPWRVILNAVAAGCETELFATQSEHYLKVVAIGALLRAGCSIIEPANRGGKGRLLWLDGGGISERLVDLPAMAAAPGSGKSRLSPDIRVCTPEPAIIELQARSQYGSQSALSSKNIADDIRRLVDRKADGFILAADQKIYDALRGLKSDNRGRRAAYPPQVWAQMLPASSVLTRQLSDAPFPSPEGLFAVDGVTLTAPGGVRRVVVAVRRAEATAP